MLRARCSLALVVLSIGLLSGQESPEAARTRQLNTEILRLRDLSGDRAAALLAEREQRLIRLIREDPDEARRMAFPAGVLREMAGRFPGARLESRPRWRGEVELAVEDGVDLVSHRVIRRLRVGRRVYDLHFAGNEPPDLECGAGIEAEGIAAGDKFLVERAAVIRQPLSAACVKTGAQKIAVILVNFPSASLPSGITANHINGVFLGNAYTTQSNTPNWSVSDFWEQNSDGQTWVEPPGGSGGLKIVGPYMLQQDYNYCSNSSSLRQAAYAAADADLNYNDYARIVIVVPNYLCSGTAGTATLGCWGSECPGDGKCGVSWTWLRGDQMATRSQGVRLVTHEVGHNLTLGHSGSRRHSEGVLGPLNVAGTRGEYGDLFSTMGSWNFGFYNAPHAVNRLNWITPSQYQTVTQAGSYSVQGYDARPAGVKALRIRRGLASDNSWFWLQYFPSNPIYLSQLNTQVSCGAILHYQDQHTPNGDTDLLDFTPGPGNFGDPALCVGQTWQDPYTPLSIRVDSIVSGLLNVTVEYGATTCTQANPTVTIAPASQNAVAGQSTSYDVSVRNNDSAGCPSRSFSLGAAFNPSSPPMQPLFSPNSVSLPAGAQTSVVLAVTTPAGSSGAYTMTVTATAPAISGTSSGSASAGLSVTAAQLPDLVVQGVTLSANSLLAGGTLTASVTVRNQGSGHAGSSVTMVRVNTNPGSSSGADPQQSVPTPAIAAGSSTVVQASFPMNTAGTYYVHAYLDHNANLTQSNTANDIYHHPQPVTVSAPAPSNPGLDSSLQLVGGTLNATALSASNRTVTVVPGALISGSIQVAIDSAWPTGTTMAMGLTPTWGNPAAAMTDSGGFTTPAAGLNRTVNVGLTAPTTPGTYHLIAAFRAEPSAAHVLSATSASAGNPIWGDGNDVAAWTQTLIDAANANGRVQANYLMPGGNSPQWIPSTAIRIVVSDPQPPPPPPQATATRFVPITPCRLLETRPEYNFEGRTGVFGPPFLWAGETRTLPVPSSPLCPTPASAKAYVLNVTLVPRGGVDFVTVWSGGDPRPDYWTARSPDGLIVANSAIVPAGPGGTIQVYTSHNTDLILDISGYFTDDPAASNLVFYPLTPCRVIDSRSEYRWPPGPFGPPAMGAGETRRFHFPQTPYCQIPAGAAAHSITVTVAPPKPLAFATLWPAGGPQPNVSSINSPSARVLANSVIIPAGAGGALDVFTYGDTDFLVDINGYFAPDDGVNGLFFYPARQCRVADTRGGGPFSGTFGGPQFGNETTRTIPVGAASHCAGLTTNAKAWAVNATVMPGGNPMPYLTLWPAGQPRPNASLVNAFDGQIVSGAGVIPAGPDGAINVFTYRPSHVVIEVSGFFGR
ncbi:MAG: hypothetical protein IPM24_27575 [Bryobacterales bacterium]|nr:hypothetical protein [Bryobacterales bacterium]